MSRTDSSRILIKEDSIPPCDTNKRYLEIGILNQAIFFWVNDLLAINQKQPFQQEMHYGLRDSDKSRTHYEMLEKSWQQLKNKAGHFILLKAILCGYSKPLALVMVLGFLKICLFFNTPIMINLMMWFVENPHPTLLQMLCLIIVLPLARLSTSVVQANSNFVLNLLGPQLKSALVALIYSKALKISIIRNKEHSIGSIVNHYEIDCDKLEWLMNIIQDLIVLPTQIMIGIGVLYWMIGRVFLGGFILMLFVGIAGYFISKKILKYQEAFMESKDKRMKLLNEILNAIKYIKMNGWEQTFIEKLNKIRSSELKVLDKGYLFETLSSANFYLIGTEGVLMTTLGLYLLFGDEFDVKKVMTMASTFWVLAWPLQRLTEVISSTVECKVAVGRIEKFLLSEEIDASYIKIHRKSEDQTVIEITNGNFSWNPYGIPVEKKIRTKNSEYELLDNCNHTIDTKVSEPSLNSLDQQKDELNFELQDLNLTVKKGDFIAVIGDVGAGKSSLFYSLVGEMYFDPSDPPEISINGEMVLLTQKPWIINASLKENILFGKPFDEELYQKCIRYAALESDLDVLPNRDDSEIGEKGINLSGGQKARVSLARALYSEGDIYLLDDVLSAVDIHVGTFIIEECLNKYLVGKTRIMITHNVDYLKYVDRIYVMENGKIMKEGTLDALKDDPHFFELLMKNSHSATKHKSEDSLIDDLPVQMVSNNINSIEKEQLEGSHQKSSTKIAEASSIIKMDLTPPPQSSDENIIEQITMAEDREVGKIKFSTIKLFLKSWGGTTSFVVVWISLSMLKEILFMGNGIFMSTWGNYETTSNFRNVMIYYAIDLIAMILHFLQVRLAFKKLVSFSGSLHTKMITSVLQAPLNLFFDRVPSGRILNRFSDDIEKIDSGFGWSIICLAISLYCVVSDLILCVAYSNVLIIIPAFILLACCWKYYCQYTGLNRELQRLKSIANSPIASFFAETLQGVVIVRNFNQQRRFFENLLNKQDERLKNNLLSGAVNNWYSVRCAFASLIIIVPVCIIVVFCKGSLHLKVGSAGYLAGQLICLGDFISWFLWELGLAETRLIALERCDHFTRIQSEKINPSNCVKIPQDWPREGSIKIKNYSTKYRPKLPKVINNLSLTIHPGEKVGIVGRTGSGKSTLMLSLLRLLESTEGSIEIDGVNIANLPLTVLREKMTVIPQDPHLFEGSLRENVDILSKYKDEAIGNALDMIKLGLLNKSNEGLGLQIKSGGENLSAGEKQMVCIARALLKKSKIILIDEATSSIDINNEEVFLKTIKEKFADCTVLTIAHRLKTIRNCDKIVVMKEGQVVEVGAPDDLIKIRGGIFSEMWNETIKAKGNFS